MSEQTPNEFEITADDLHECKINFKDEEQKENYQMAKRITIKHLKENNTSYKAHWWRAMSMSVALFIHAWIPSLLPTYASDKMGKH